ncbi:MAG TPA: kelch repeat-containing protein [Polyangiaceae bacterium]|nr:kelch repeat-containing protein [Polyangiaceae bacterium]
MSTADADGGSLTQGDAGGGTGGDASDGGVCAGGGGPGTFTCTGSLSVPREAPGAAVLANGKVLVAGGWNATGGALSTAEVYDPATGTFAATGGMSASHLWSGWASPWPVLANGKVLAAGGLDSSGSLLTIAELYDPAAGTFSTTGPLATGVIAFGATTLSGGTVLFLGGYDAVTVAPPTPAWSYTAGTSAVQGYDPSSGMFAAAGTLAEPRLFGCNVRLASGDVLAIGGWVGTGPTFESNIERFDPTMTKWTTVGTLPDGVTCSASAFVLPGGKVLLDGSAILDPATYTTTPTATPLALISASLAQLAGGDVLAAGGSVGGAPTARAQVYRATTNTWTDVGAMHFVRGGGHRLVTLPSGDVFVVGGADADGALASVEIYHP